MADSTLYLYTSLTAGSSHLITATSRMETILKANRIPFRALDCATDEKARQLWGRRSKGKKLPGLVKYGQVVGDLEQVEEWNEFGELVDQIEDVDDLYGDTPMTDTVLPPPVDVNPPSLLKPIIEKAAGMPPTVSRTSSDSRHISISEPAAKKEKADATAKTANAGTSLAATMAQLGAEAAAKAGGLKKTLLPSTTTSTTTSTTKATADQADAASKPTAADVPITKKPDPSETIPNAAQVKASSDAALDSNSEEEKQSITAAKTPAQLASEGVRTTSIDKSSPIASSSTLTDDIESTSIPAAEGKSTEEQVLDIRRSSSIVKTESGLAQGTSIDDIDENGEEQSPEEKAAAEAIANVEKEMQEEKQEQKQKAKEAVLGHGSIPEQAVVSEPASVAVSTDDVSTTARPSMRTHRGSSIGEAPQDEIKKIEERNAIKEEDEEDEDGDEAEADDEDEDEANDNEKSDANAKDNKDSKAIGATDQEEKKVTKDSNPQDTEAAEPKDAGKSVGD